ncbi:unnamed protein product [Adineta ricciae]|uniref:PiggyBac transposable element-derived protein 4-like protein n=1 Tax=Adineta ricciae TaxID=249248 RepID=A0A815L2K5_ADIRI|nr:unnamed protein product [Adineta ricciae]CAF1634135.1 unnamed protein product [Adineta ricciae]
MARRRDSSDHEILEIIQNAESECESYEDDIDENYLSADSSEEENDISMDSANISNLSDEDGSPLPKRKMPRLERKWREGQFVPQVQEFTITNSGISSNLLNNPLETPFDFFEYFFDASLVGSIVTQTNLYQHQNNSNPTAKTALWTDTDIPEMYVFFAATILMSYTKKNRIKDFWSTDSLISTPIFGELFTRNRYLSILRYLHFNDNTCSTLGDRLFKLKPILLNLKEKFSKSMYPYKNLVIDESLMLWRGRLMFKQYIPSKRHRFGVKLFILCDCKTRFILDFIIYTGSTTEIKIFPTLGISGSIVMSLMEKYFYVGHVLYMDNWYSSSVLYETLHDMKTGACGTVRPNRVGLPNMSKKLKAGEKFSQFTDNLLYLKWYDRREVNMLTTIHNDDMIITGKINQRTNEPIVKPLCIVEYNSNMGAIDKTDMQISFSECTRKTIKWYKKLFLHILDMALLNGYIIYKQKTGKRLTFLDYRLEVTREIVQKFGSLKKKGRGRPSLTSEPLRLTGRHFPSRIEPNGNNHIRRRKCIVCSRTNLAPKKRTDTLYECVDCDVGLCIDDCFKKYHTLERF